MEKGKFIDQLAEQNTFVGECPECAREREEIIQSCLKDFDFKKIQFVMSILETKIYSKETHKLEVPTAKELIELAYGLLENAYNDLIDEDVEETSRSTAGFTASAFFEENEVCVRLAYELESSFGCLECDDE